MSRVSEKILGDVIEAALVMQGSEDSFASPDAGCLMGLPGGYLKRAPKDYDRALCLIPGDLIDFVIATQPREWNKLKQHHGDDIKSKFAKRVSHEIDRRGTLDVLRKDIKDSGCKFRLAYFRPHSGLNDELQRLYAANLFTVVRELHYSQANENSLDLVLFINGIPIFTAELKNPLTGQTVENAVEQYRVDRDPGERLFSFGRCLGHFAVDFDEVFITTHLRGPQTRFLPFNQGYERGAGNPPTRTTYATAYLWKQIWARDSILNLVQHFIYVVKEGDGGKKNGSKVQLFPRYHQLEAVRRLVVDAHERGVGNHYLIQHSAGSGKSYTISWLAHWLSVLHDDDDVRVFDSIIVITDRRVLDQQLQHTVRQFEQTLGVVENINTTSKQLKQALEDGRTIIVTTLQKFPVIVDEARQLAGKRFAVIVDEAHSSQSGESTKALKSVLSTKDLAEAAAEERGKEEDLEDRIVAEMKKRGRLDNASTFAFTATPKQKTLELFGVHRPDGKFEPFSLYSMRQAIEEGFILDVLENYTTYTTYFKLLKKIEEDPRYDKAKAQYLLKSFVDLHEHAVRQKVEIMAGHFHDQVQHRINGRAKAMIITRSRLHAVRYKLAIDRYLEEQGYPYKTVVAFSGSVHDPGVNHNYTEAGMNCFPEVRTAAMFHQPEYRLMVCAFKFQTGFDEPLLHTMYVDRPLAGVNAVQTLSRLNRTHSNKFDTMVLDFVNNAEAIKEAFDPYYETTLLSEATDPNILYTLEADLADFDVYTRNEVDGFAKLYFADATQAELYFALRPICERAEQLKEDELRDFRGRLKDYVQQYAFLSQVVTFVDPDLEKFYAFARILHRCLPSMRNELSREIQQKIDMGSYRVQRTFTGELDLKRGDSEVHPRRGIRSHTVSPEDLEPLSRIIEELNDRFGVGLGPDDRVALKRVEDRLHEDKSLRLSVENNTEENARLAWETKFDDMMHDLLESDFKLYKRIVDNPVFHKHLHGLMFESYCEWVEGGGLTVADIMNEISEGESMHREFKSTLRWNLHTEKYEKRITKATLKSIAAFQNTEGGIVYLGVNDEGDIVGIEADGFASDDRFLLHLNNVVTESMEKPAATRIIARVWAIAGKTVCRVECRRSPKPVFLNFENKESFFVRTGPSTAEMTPSEMHAYISEHFPE